MTDILPTHSCFDDALDYLTERVREDAALAFGDDLILVHAIAVASSGPHEGEPYAHAWVEEQGLCWDAGLLHGQRVWYAVAQAEYYAARRIQATTRYTVHEALRENRRTGNYGPWQPEYRALCGREDRRTFGAIAATYDGTQEG